MNVAEGIKKTLWEDEGDKGAIAHVLRYKLFNICNIANVKYDRHKQDIVGQFQMHLYPPGLWGSEGTV